MPDWFLVAWWLLAVAIGIPMFILVRRSDLLGRQRAVLAHLRGVPPGRYPAWQGAQIWRPIQIPVAVLIVLLILGWVALIVIYDWTRLLLLHGQIFLVVCGVGVAMLGLSATAFASMSAQWKWMRAIPWLMRTVFALSGIAIVAFIGNAVIQDLAWPRRVVEGHVDRVYKEAGYDLNSAYVVVIDGKRYRATREVFVHILPTRRVRVEIGAGSGMIFASDAGSEPASN